MSDEEIQVSYTVKELLSQLNQRIDSFMPVLAGKADQAAVAHANERIDGLTSRVATLERDHQASKEHRSATTEFKRWAIPAALSLITVIVLILQGLHL